MKPFEKLADMVGLENAMKWIDLVGQMNEESLVADEAETEVKA